MNGQVSTHNVREFAAAGHVQPLKFNYEVNISREKLSVWMDIEPFSLKEMLLGKFIS